MQAHGLINLTILWLCAHTTQRFLCIRTLLCWILSSAERLINKRHDNWLERLPQSSTNHVKQRCCWNIRELRATNFSLNRTMSPQWKRKAKWTLVTFLLRCRPSYPLCFNALCHCLVTCLLARRLGIRVKVACRIWVRSQLHLTDLHNMQAVRKATSLLQKPRSASAFWALSHSLRPTL